MEAPDFDLFKQKRRRDDGARNATLRRAESPERGASQVVGWILHVGVDGRIIADSEDIAEGPQRKTFDHSATRRLLVPVGYIDFGYSQRHTLTAGNATGNLAHKIGKVLLMDRRERRIGHSFDFEAPFVAVVTAGS